MAGDPAHAKGCGILDHPPAQFTRLAIGGNDAAAQRFPRQETRVGHPEWLEDMPPHVEGERLATGTVDQFAERDETDVAIEELASGWPDQLRGHHSLEGRRFA